MPTACLLDACCLLNMLASGHCESILGASLAGFPNTYAVVENVVSEVRFLRRGGDGDDAEVREPIDLQPLFSAGHLLREQLESAEEKQLFMEFATQLDDGEAATCALSVQRGYDVMTDDKKARRLLAATHSKVRCIGTLEVMKAWSDGGQKDHLVIAKALRDIQERANFIPPRQSPLRSWWESMMRD